MNDQYIRTLQDTIRRKHRCSTAHVDTVPISETFQGGTVWEGEVEVFEVLEDKRATQCFAWGLQKEKSQQGQCVAILKSRLVPDAAWAVRVFIMSGQKN